MAGKACAGHHIHLKACSQLTQRVPYPQGCPLPALPNPTQGFTGELFQHVAAPLLFVELTTGQKRILAGP